LFALGGKTQGPIISVGTFSKVLAPGLRVGWVIAHSHFISKLVQAKQSADLHTATFNQYLVHELATSGLLLTHVPKLCAEYGIRRYTMLAALKKAMPEGVTWSRPAGGMFLLLRLPAEMRGADIARSALQENVLVVPGEDFHVQGGENTLRLNFSNAAPAEIRTGVQRLASIIARVLMQPSKYPVSFSRP